MDGQHVYVNAHMFPTYNMQRNTLYANCLITPNNMPHTVYHTVSLSLERERAYVCCRDRTNVSTYREPRYVGTYVYMVHISSNQNYQNLLSCRHNDNYICQCLNIYYFNLFYPFYITIITIIISQSRYLCACRWK